MQPQAKKFIGISLIILGIAVAAYVLVRATLYAPDDEVGIPNTGSTVGVGEIVSPNSILAADVPPEEYPSRIEIPRIDVNAAVQHVGVKENGNMANPSNFTDVGWYKHGTVPGYDGSAVMAGHVDNALALDGVFKELTSLQAGDDLYVTSKEGERLHFKVEKIETYHYQDAPEREIFALNDGKARLNLITCGGTWIRSAQSYDERIVVYTVLVE